MNKNSTLKFGKYKGLTIEEVYIGSKNINRQLLKEYLINRLNDVSCFNPDDHDLIEMLNIEISDSQMIITPLIDVLEGDVSKIVEEYFKDTLRVRDDFFDTQSLDNFNIYFFSKDKDIPEITAGNPLYIGWCILNLNHFFVDPSDFRELTNSYFHVFKGLNLTFKGNNFYEYQPVFELMRYEPSEKILQLNNDKY